MRPSIGNHGTANMFPGLNDGSGLSLGLLCPFLFFELIAVAMHPTLMLCAVLPSLNSVACTQVMYLSSRVLD